jgi:CubicO group peptidase (beta-lactamase class C family)
MRRPPLLHFESEICVQPTFKYFAGVLAATLLASATASNALAQSDGTATKPSKQSMNISPNPEQLGFSKDRLARLGPIFDAKIAAKMWPGSVSLVARHGQLVHFEAHGNSDANGKSPMRRDSIFRVMSMTKPVVSVATMVLVENGLITLDDPIERYLPELKDLTVMDAANPSQPPQPINRSITVYDLLRHAAGFTWVRGADAGRPQYVRDIANAYVANDLQPGVTDQTPEQFLTRLSKIPLIFQPGTGFEYAISTDVLGVLLERVTGKRLETLVQETVFTPLKMVDSDWHVPPDKRSRLADAFDSDPAKVAVWRAARVDIPPGMPIRSASAGLFSTAPDYFRFAQMLLNGGELDGVRILSPKTIELMMANHIEGLTGSPAAVSGPGYGFGLGFGVRLDLGGGVVPGSVGDTYWPGISGTSFTVDRKNGVVAVYLVQAPTNRIAARHMFKNVVYAAMTR